MSCCFLQASPKRNERGGVGDQFQGTMICTFCAIIVSLAGNDIIEKEIV